MDFGEETYLVTKGLLGREVSEWYSVGETWYGKHYTCKSSISHYYRYRDNLVII